MIGSVSGRKEWLFSENKLMRLLSLPNCSIFPLIKLEAATVSKFSGSAKLFERNSSSSL